jgi:hypothetical protein
MSKGQLVKQYSEITEKEIDQIRKLDDYEAGVVFDQRLREIAKNERRSFIEIGLICREVDSRDVWATIVSPETGEMFTSFKGWVYSSLGIAGSTAYTAMKVLDMGTDLDTLRMMPRRNATRLSRLSTQVQRDPKVIEAALVGTEKEFIAFVQQHYPDQHVEPERMVLATPPESDRANIIECFDAVRWCYDVENREDVMANLVAYFWDGPCEREGADGMSNRQAWEERRE